MLRPGNKNWRLASDCELDALCTYLREIMKEEGGEEADADEVDDDEAGHIIWNAL